MLRNIQTEDQFGLNAEGKQQELALDYDRCVRIILHSYAFSPLNQRIIAHKNHGCWYRFHGDVICRVTWASGTTGWQKIVG